jgi:hypothetical protein
LIKTFWAWRDHQLPDGTGMIVRYRFGLAGTHWVSAVSFVLVLWSHHHLGGTGESPYMA